MGATDASGLCAFRAAFGVLMLVHVVRLHVHGLYSRSVLMPGFHFDFGFAIPVPSSDVVGAAHLIALGVAALGLAVGVRSRACAFAFALLYGWFVLCERTMFNNHFYLYTLLAILLSLVEAQQQFTLRPRAGRAGDRCRSWERAALRAQLCIVYMYAGIAKLNSDWLLHAEPMASKLAVESTRHHASVRGLLCRHEVAVAVSLCGVVVDLALPGLLLWPHGRGVGLALASLFHTGNLLLWQLGEFPLLMLATNLLFLEPTTDVRFLGQTRPREKACRGVAKGAAEGAAPSDADDVRGAACATVETQHSRWPLAAASVLLAVQLVLPLRPLLASGFDPLDAVHTKSHTLFSWRFMAVSTRNFVNVTLRSEQLGASLVMTRTYNKLALVHHTNGSRIPLQLQPSLEPRQAGYMAYTAPMLVQFARHAAARHPGYAVHGDLWSAVNDRPLQRFAAPQTDLATAELPAWRRPAWVLPLLSDYGARPWRARVRWLRRRLGGLDVAFFAHARGGSFDEAFPAVGSFPARALLVPLDGRLLVRTPRGTRELEPPEWGENAQGKPEMRPRAAPVSIPFGAVHRVINVGDGTACWAYVFGSDHES